jgi:PHD/YefM family antitoxin component YafN of YafNO toxin-antitoxin module
MAKVKIDDGLYDRARRAAEAAGYSSVEEFIADSVEKAIQRLKVEEQEGQVSEQLRGLGYIE